MKVFIVAIWQVLEWGMAVNKHKLSKAFAQTFAKHAYVFGAQGLGVEDENQVRP